MHRMGYGTFVKKENCQKILEQKAVQLSKKIGADSHTVQLSKKAHSRPVKLSKRNYRSQPPRKIVKLHFGMIFAGKHI